MKVDTPPRREVLRVEGLMLVSERALPGSLGNQVLLECYYLPDQLEARLAEFGP